MNLGRMSRRDLLGLLGAAAASGLPAAMIGPARAQARFPDRPIRLVVPFPPGGIYDALGRPWADKMKTLLGAVVVENVGGAGGAIGGAAVVRARPDGYTLLLGGIAINVINAVATTRPLYDPRQLESVSILASAVFAIAVHPSVPVQSLQELIRFAEANPGRLSYGTAGTGSLNHLTGERLKSLTGLAHITHVPYRGAGPALTDLVSGQILMAVPSVSGQVVEFHRTGKLRMLAITGAQRLPAAAEIPTAAESGLPGLTAEQYIGLYAPPGTPAPIIGQIAEATRLAIADRELHDRLIALGLAPSTDTSPGRMRDVVEQEFALWTPVIKAIDLKLD